MLNFAYCHLLLLLLWLSVSVNVCTRMENAVFHVYRICIFAFAFIFEAMRHTLTINLVTAR